MEGPDTRPSGVVGGGGWGAGGAGGWGSELGVDDLEGRTSFISRHP